MARPLRPDRHQDVAAQPSLHPVDRRFYFGEEIGEDRPMHTCPGCGDRTRGLLPVPPRAATKDRPARNAEPADDRCARCRRLNIIPTKII